jgi:hypothetical protein
MTEGKMMSIKRYIFTLSMVMAIALLPICAWAVDDPMDLLPKDHEISSWVMAGPEAYYYPSTLERILDDKTAAIVNDYDLDNLLSQYYTSGEDQIEVMIFTMSDPEQAYGLFSVFGDIRPETTDQDIVVENIKLSKPETVNKEMRVVSDKEVHLIGDHFFVRILTPDDAHQMDLIYFANKIQQKFDRTGAVVPGTKVLESKQKIFGTERVIGGYHALALYLPVGNFDPFLLGEDGVRCLQADYRLTPGTMYRQLVFEYPDIATAKKAYEAFTEWTEHFGDLKRINYADAIGTVVAENEDGQYIAGFRDGKYLRVFHGLDSMSDLGEVIAQYK